MIIREPSPLNLTQLKGIVFSVVVQCILVLNLWQVILKQGLFITTLEKTAWPCFFIWVKSQSGLDILHRMEGSINIRLQPASESPLIFWGLFVGFSKLNLSTI